MICNRFEYNPEYDDRFNLLEKFKTIENLIRYINKYKIGLCSFCKSSDGQGRYFISEWEFTLEDGPENTEKEKLLKRLRQVLYIKWTEIEEKRCHKKWENFFSNPENYIGHEPEQK